MHLFRSTASCGMPSHDSGSDRGQDKGKKFAKALISGSITGGLEISITYPTEYIKTMQQLYKHYQKMGAVNCAKETIKNSGFFGLYKGYTCLLAFSIPKMGVRFSSKEFFDNTIFTTKSRYSTFLSGAMAGAMEALIVVTPQETVKTKIVNDRLLPNPKFKGFIDGMVQIKREGGWGALYKGPLATVLKQSSNQAIRFFIYEDCMKLTDTVIPSAPLPIKTLLSGAIAGAGSVIGNTPIDVIKTQLQGLESEKYKGTVDCAVQIFKKDGILGFYKGVGPRMVRVVMDVALSFTFFENIKRFLNHIWP